MLSLKKIIPISLILVMTISDVRASEKPISLPYPFKEKYSNPENDYQKYLKNTPMLPNPNVCQILISNSLPVLIKQIKQLSLVLLHMLLEALEIFGNKVTWNITFAGKKVIENL